MRGGGARNVGKTNFNISMQLLPSLPLSTKSHLMKTLAHTLALAAIMLAAPLLSQAQTREAYLKGVESCLQRKNPTCAIMALEKTIEAFPNDPENYMLYYRMGKLYEQVNYVPKALESYDKGLALMPGDPMLLCAKAGMLVQLGYFGEAMDIYTAILKKDPNQKDALIGRAEMYLRSGNTDKAEADLMKLNREYGNDPGIVLLLAEIAMEKGKMDEGIEYCNQLIVNDPSNGRYYNMRAKIYQRKGELQMAKVDAMTAINLDKGMAEYYITKGRIEVEMGDTSAACKTGKDAMKNGLAEYSVGELMQYCSGSSK